MKLNYANYNNPDFERVRHTVDAVEIAHKTSWTGEGTSVQISRVVARRTKKAAYARLGDPIAERYQYKKPTNASLTRLQRVLEDQRILPEVEISAYSIELVYRF